MGNLDRLSLADVRGSLELDVDKLQRMNTDKALCGGVLCVIENRKYMEG